MENSFRLQRNINFENIQIFTPPQLVVFNKSFTFKRFCALFAPKIRKSGPGNRESRTGNWEPGIAESGIRNRELGIGNRELGIGESGNGNRQLQTVNWESGIAESEIRNQEPEIGNPSETVNCA